MKTYTVKTGYAAIAAIVLSTVISQAATDLNNKEIIGEWCIHTSEDGTSISRKEQGENCGDGILNIQMNGIRAWEHSCRYTTVNTWYDSTIPTATRTPTGALVSRIEMACSGEGCTWRERVTVHLGKGELAYTSNWRSKDKCRG
jgi:hypothetical protein